MAQADLDAIRNLLIPFAQQMLATAGGFHPFGGSMRMDGQLVQDAAHTGSEYPPSEELIELLTGGFRHRAASGEIRAAGICFDIRVVPPGASKKSDAIFVQVEDFDGEAIRVFVPYKKGLLGKIKYGEMFALQGTPAFFRPPGSGE